jgi:hypothetical protein
LLLATNADVASNRLRYIDRLDGTTATKREA